VERKGTTTKLMEYQVFHESMIERKPDPFNYPLRSP